MNYVHYKKIYNDGERGSINISLSSMEEKWNMFVKNKYVVMFQLSAEILPNMKVKVQHLQQRRWQS